MTDVLDMSQCITASTRPTLKISLISWNAVSLAVSGVDSGQAC